jgi:sulfate transport system ATP-binding protein
MSIVIEHISKRFGTFTALNDINLAIEPGELVALLGPSGSGKTTLLRIIAGLEDPDSGRVLIDGEDAGQRDFRQRAVGFVFQHYALFRHMTVFENVAFGLRVKPRRERLSKTEIAKKVHQLLELVQLDWLAQQYPHQLSGGQRQRIALARALAVEPQVLLLDEPFGALDAKVRKDLRRWLRRLHDEIHLTSVFVTHDQEEALEVSDRVVVFNHGKIEQIGRPDEVYDHPSTPFVYGFLGHANRFDTRIEAGFANLDRARLAVKGESSTGNGVAYVRPHDLEVVDVARNDTFEAEVDHVIRLGPTVRIELTTTATQQPIEVEMNRERFAELSLERKQRVFLAPRRARIFPVGDNPSASHYDVVPQSSGETTLASSALALEE